MPKRRIDKSDLGRRDDEPKTAGAEVGDDIEITVKPAERAPTAEDAEEDPPIGICTRVRRVPWGEATLLMRIHSSDLTTPSKIIEIQPTPHRTGKAM